MAEMSAAGSARSMSGGPGIELPLADDPQFPGWREDWEAEADLWTAARALARSGETGQERWVGELRDEVSRREEWWQRSNVWCRSVTGNANAELLTSTQEAVWHVMRWEEADRRLCWGFWMRSHAGFGESLDTWKPLWRRHYKRVFTSQPSAPWPFVWEGTTEAVEVSSSSSEGTDSEQPEL